MALSVVTYVGRALGNVVNAVYNFLLDCTNWPLAFLLLAGGNGNILFLNIIPTYGKRIKWILQLTYIHKQDSLSRCISDYL